MRESDEVFEYDGHEMSPQGKDTPENRALLEKAKLEAEELIQRIKAEYGL